MKKSLWLLVGLLVWGSASAATVTVTLTPSTLSVDKPTDVVLTWASTGAGKCTAVGSWTGVKNLSGSETVRVTASGSYSLTCESPTGPANLTWTPADGKNTDGTTATITGYQVFSGPSPSTLARLQVVPGATTKSAVVEAPPGVTYFALRAQRADGIESVDAVAPQPKSVVADKATAAVSISFSVKPNPPTNFVVE
jgi:hypothetical protein